MKDDSRPATPTYSFSVPITNIELRKLLDEKKERGNLSAFIRECTTPYLNSSPNVIQEILARLDNIQETLEGLDKSKLNTFTKEKERLDMGDLFDI